MGKTSFDGPECIKEVKILCHSRCCMEDADHVTRFLFVDGPLVSSLTPIYDLTFDENFMLCFVFTCNV